MEALCIFFDLEATGLFIQYAEVVEIASVARLLSSEGLWQDSSWSPTGGEFRILVRPKKKLPRKIARMTGLSNAQLQRDGVRFQAAIGAWVAWLRSETAAVDKARGKHIPLWLIGHNAMTYDLPLLVAQDRREHLSSAAATLYVPPCPVAPFEGVDNLAGVLDTLRISRALAKARKSSKDVLSMGRRLQHRQSGQSSKTSHALGALYRRALGHPLPAAHSALGDARGLAAICSRSPLHHAVFSAVAGSTFSMAAGALQTLPALSAARQMALRAAGLARDRRHGRKQKSKRQGPTATGSQGGTYCQAATIFWKEAGWKAQKHSTSSVCARRSNAAFESPRKEATVAFRCQSAYSKLSAKACCVCPPKSRQARRCGLFCRTKEVTTLAMWGTEPQLGNLGHCYSPCCMVWQTFTNSIGPE